MILLSLACLTISVRVYSEQGTKSQYIGLLSPSSTGNNWFGSPTNINVLIVPLNSCVCIISNKLEFTNEGIKLTFPYDKDDCDEGISKKAIVETYKERYKKVYFIGDGYSDIDAASKADFVFAKKGRYLEKFCNDNSIEFLSYETFADIIDYIAKNLGGKKCL